MHHPSWIEVDLGQFQKNLQQIQFWIGKCRLCLLVKANAYGHGLVEIGKAAQMAGVHCLGVSCLQEGVQLRKEGITTPILVLGAIHEEQIEELCSYDLEFTISSQFKAELVSKKAQKKCRVHLEVDTGMQRTGVRPETAIELAKMLRANPRFDLVGVYSHLATADRAEDLNTRQQIELFKKLLKEPVFHGVLSHLANSGGVAHYPEVHLDMVRIGLMAYGYPPPNAPAPLSQLAPCFSLKAKVSYFKVVEAGAGIGYGHTYQTKKRTRIVTIPIGYGDGYRRALSNKGHVLIRGKKFPIVGNICMDQLMVDIGEETSYVGDEVVLIGKQGAEEIPLAEVAKICDTISYEVLCSFNLRLPRKSISF